MNNIKKFLEENYLSNKDVDRKSIKKYLKTPYGFNMFYKKGKFEEPIDEVKDSLYDLLDKYDNIDESFVYESNDSNSDIDLFDYINKELTTKEENIVSNYFKTSPMFLTLNDDGSISRGDDTVLFITKTEYDKYIDEIKDYFYQKIAAKVVVDDIVGDIKLEDLIDREYFLKNIDKYVNREVIYSMISKSIDSTKFDVIEKNDSLLIIWSKKK